jgi:hypothetical protein
MAAAAASERSVGLFSYLIALVVGVLVVAHLMPLDSVLGTGALWTSPTGDLAQNLTGHLAFQAPGWSMPPLLAPGLFWPHGLSIAMTDSNPLVSLLAKLIAALRGGPVNLLGFWFAACWLIQPIAAVYALRGMGSRSWIAALAAAVIAPIFPALLYRVMHINLCGQFTLLFALGLALRMIRRPALGSRSWIAPCVLLIAAVLIHPYLFAFSAAVLAAPALHGLLDRRPGAWRLAGCFVGSAVIPVLVYGLLSGTLGGGDRGFGFFSMNLLSPVWPQLSGLFGPDLPILDPTGGEYEGFNYLGGGGLLLVALALVALARGGAWGSRFGVFWRRWRGLLIMLLCLTLLALTTNVYAGRYPLLLLGARPWDQVFGPLQSAGRAFWVVGYALLLASIACLEARLPRTLLAPALAVVVVLQWIDTGPLRAVARDYFAGNGQHPPAFAIPPGLKLLTTLPVCMQDGPVTRLVATERLAAERAGALLSDVKTSRLPKWFNCETVMSDFTELPLAQGEMRIFLTPPAIERFRQATLGEDTTCRADKDMIVCTRGVAPPQGVPPPPGLPVPALSLGSDGATVSGAALAPFLSWNWKTDADGLVWSETPRSTLLFRVPEGRPPGPPRVLRVRLTLDGVGASPGADRKVTIRVGPTAQTEVTLPDLKPAVVDLLVPPSDAPDGIVRIAFDIFHPIDPSKRALAAPVGRAGVRLQSLSVQDVPTQPSPSG